MIQKEKLVQFYFSQYRDSAMALKKKNNDGKKTYEQRIGRLITEMQRTKTGKLTQPHLEEYHRQIRNMAYYALKQKNQYAIMQIRDILMPELVRLDIGTLREEEQELVTSRLLEYLRTARPGEICQHPMRSILKNFAENGIRSQIIDMVPTRPEMEFPRALEMKRHFILHVGPTNFYPSKDLPELHMPSEPVLFHSRPLSFGFYEMRAALPQRDLSARSWQAL